MRRGLTVGSWLACTLALGVGAAQAADPPKDLAPRTAESGAELSPTAQAMALPQLALALDVDPAGQSIRGLAEYTVTAAAPLEQVEFDLDPRFGISRVTVDGEIVAPGGWSNDGGLLRIALPSPLEAGRGRTRPARVERRP